MENDYLIFWSAGYNFLHGLDPYAVKGNYYPPATNLLFALMAILPLKVSFIFWGALCALMLIHGLRKRMQIKKTFVWFTYFPTLFLIFTGQPDIFFLWLFSFMNRKDWIAALAAALLTLKPQIALIALPWFLLTWLLKERKTLLIFFAFTTLISILPILFNMQIYQRWITVTSKVTNVYVVNSPGIFSFTYFPIPLLVLVPFALGIALYGLFLGNTGSLAANFLATPLGTWYNTILLAGVIPWQWLIPTSWVAFGLAVVAKAAYPLCLIPVVAFIWLVKNARKAQVDKDQSPNSVHLPAFREKL
jgi:hypothetical protein